VNIEHAYSYSGLKEFSECNKKRFYRTSPDHKPAFRSAAFLIGSASHAAIKLLHENPNYDIPSLCRDMIDSEIRDNEDVPVDWGATGREKREVDMIELIEVYWQHNEGVELLSSERWFYVRFEHPMIKPVTIRGRFDQLRTNKNRLVIYELKTGKMRPEIRAMQNDEQVPLQNYAMRYGVVLLDDEPYAPDNPHIHDFPENNLLPECTKCHIKGQRFATWPHAVYRYYPYGLVPLKSNAKDGRKKGDPRFPALYECTFTEEQIERFREKMAAQIRSYQLAEETGCWLPTGRTAYQSPCPDCPYQSVCKSDVATVRIVEGEQ